MTDAELDELESKAKILIDVSPVIITSLITVLRRTRKERDWLATNLANGLVDPDCIEHLKELGGMSPPDPATLIEAAREATCQKN